MKCCPLCGFLKPVKDFFGKPVCYKCVYSQKKNQLGLKNRCKLCLALIPKGRSKFCGRSCQKAFNDGVNKSCWWKKITIVNAIIMPGWH